MKARKVSSVTALSGDIYGTEKAGTVKNGDDFRQETSALPGTGVWIDDQIKGFQGDAPLRVIDRRLCIFIIAKKGVKENQKD